MRDQQDFTISCNRTALSNYCKRPYYPTANVCNFSDYIGVCSVQTPLQHSVLVTLDPNSFN